MAVSIFLLLLSVVIALLLLHKTLRKRLSVRIAALLLVVGPVALTIIIIFNAVAYGWLNLPAPWWLRLIQTLIVIVGTSLILGVLATRFVTKPLNQFYEAIASLRASNYQTKLKLTGVREFDRVFGEFNELVSRLHQEEELRKNLISDTSHELNTPLAVMAAQLTAMQEGVLPVTKSRIHQLVMQTDRLTELTTRLNEYTKARSAAAAKETINFYEFCGELRDMFVVQFEEKHIDFNIKVPTSYTIRASRQSLQSIMVNLTQNTLRYSNGKTITIVITENKITFSDDGQ